MNAAGMYTFSPVLVRQGVQAQACAGAGSSPRAFVAEVGFEPLYDTLYTYGSWGGCIGSCQAGAPRSGTQHAPAT